MSSVLDQALHASQGVGAGFFSSSSSHFAVSMTYGQFKPFVTGIKG